MIVRRLGTALAAVVVALGATTTGLVLTAPAATAATCTDAAGISVVVDFKGLGGGQQTGCVTGKGGSSAATVLAAAGVELTRARNQQGFVCRVQQVPADDPCVNASPAEAYWSLWWSDGSSGSWTYASLGVDQLEIPEGGSVGFAWDDQPGQAQPGTAPPTRPAASSGGQGGSGSTSSGGSSPSASATPAAPEGTASAGAATDDERADEKADQQREQQEEKDRQAKKGAKADRGGKDADATDDPEATEDPDDETVVDLDGSEPTAVPAGEPDGLPTWVAPVALGLLGLALAGVAVVRRRRQA